MMCLLGLLLTLGISNAQATAPDSVEQEFVIEVYVMTRAKILLNGEHTNIRGLKKYLRANQVDSARIGTLRPTPLEVFPTFNAVVELMNEYGVDNEWYRDPEFTRPFFEDESTKN